MDSATGAAKEMPKRPAKPCRHPGCPELVNARYCGPHARLHHAEFDRGRPSFRKRYGPGWAKLRRQVLARDYLCQTDMLEAQMGRRKGCHPRGCYNRATEAHHIIAKRQGGTDSLNNLIGLCKPCHSERTARETWRRS